jgi:hypothetical protein
MEFTAANLRKKYDTILLNFARTDVKLFSFFNSAGR